MDSIPEDILNPKSSPAGINPSAMEHLRKAQEMETSGLVASASREYCLYAQACEAQDRFEDAIKFLEHADSLYPISIQERLKLAKSYHQIQDEDGAAKQYSILAESFFDQGLSDRAVEIFTLALQEMPESLALRLGLADLLSRAKQTQKAIREYREVLNRQPDNPTAHLRLGDIFIKRNNRDEALQELAHAAEIFTSQGRIDEAITCYRKILKIFPDYIQFRRKLIEALDTRNDKHEFVEECLRLGELLWNNGEHEKAEKIYERILEIDPHNPVAQMRLSGSEPTDEKINPQSEELETTIHAMDTSTLDTFAEEVRPGVMDLQSTVVETIDSSTSYDLGLAYMEMALLDDAINELQRAALDPEYRMAASNLLGLCFLEQDRIKLAIRSFFRALDTPGDDAKRKVVFFNLARAYMELDELNMALDALYDAYVIDGKFNDIAKLIGEVERRIKARSMKSESNEKREEE